MSHDPMASAPTPDELGPLLSETSELDAPMQDPYASEDGEFMAAARSAVGTDQKANALKDAIESCLRKHGLLTDEVADDEDTEEMPSDVGAGFPDA